MRRRIIGLFCVFLALFGGLVVRLYILSGRTGYASAATRQSSYLLEVARSRGKIYDSEMQLLVDRETEYLAAVTPSPEAEATLFTALPQQVWETVREKMEQGQPFVLPVDGDDLTGAGVQVFETLRRYGPMPIAAHVVGYLGADGGMAGIESAYDAYLKDHGDRLLVRYAMNAAGQAIPGAAVQQVEENFEQAGGVVLTLDREIQQAAEESAARHFDIGAVVVMDVRNGDLKAVVSLPTFDPDHVADALDQSDSPLLNRAFCAYNVGSTFKLLVEATAIEHGVLYHTNDCPGYIQIGETIFRCHKLTGHGTLDLRGALEKSCNPYFISLMQQVGGQTVLHKAIELGFGQSQELAPGITTASGTLPTYDDLLTPAEEANFAFGQGKLSATPVQIARLIAAVANGGYSVTPRLVAGFTEDGKTLSAAEPVYGRTQVIEEDAAERVREDMVAVVVEGSGTKARPELLGAGGKTGSAQTGRFREDGTEVVHAWFAGFYPAEDPVYSIVVLAEGMESGGDFAAPVFAEICDEILASGKLVGTRPIYYEDEKKAESEETSHDEEGSPGESQPMPSNGTPLADSNPINEPETPIGAGTLPEEAGEPSVIVP